MFFLLTSIAYADDLNKWSQDISPDSNLSFVDGQIRYVQFGNPPFTQFTPYILNTENNIDFINFEYPGNWFKEELFSGSVKWLVLKRDDMMFLYAADNSMPINNGILGRTMYNLDSSKYEYACDSFLTENNLEYGATNLGNLKCKMPWVEGVDGYGIGQKIYIKSKTDSTKMSSILLSNGFVSYQKTYLYKYNSRLKRIKITNEEEGFVIIQDLLDSPNLQLITLPSITSDVIIEIIDIYKGDKWEDTCVNFIIPYERF